jgi:hypothetical protein
MTYSYMKAFLFDGRSYVLAVDAKRMNDRIEQLEAALRRISNKENWGTDGGWEADSYPDEIARAALGEEGDKYDGWR